MYPWSSEFFPLSPCIQNYPTSLDSSCIRDYHRDRKPDSSTFSRDRSPRRCKTTSGYFKPASLPSVMKVQETPIRGKGNTTRGEEREREGETKDRLRWVNKRAREKDENREVKGAEWLERRFIVRLEHYLNKIFEDWLVNRRIIKIHRKQVWKWI